MGKSRRNQKRGASSAKVTAKTQAEKATKGKEEEEKQYSLTSDSDSSSSQIIHESMRKVPGDLQSCTQDNKEQMALQTACEESVKKEENKENNWNDTKDSPKKGQDAAEEKTATAGKRKEKTVAVKRNRAEERKGKLKTVQKMAEKGDTKIATMTQNDELHTSTLPQEKAVKTATLIQKEKAEKTVTLIQKEKAEKTATLIQKEKAEKTVTLTQEKERAVNTATLIKKEKAEKTVTLIQKEKAEKMAMLTQEYEKAEKTVTLTQEKEKAEKTTTVTREEAVTEAEAMASLSSDAIAAIERLKPSPFYNKLVVDLVTDLASTLSAETVRTLRAEMEELCALKTFQRKQDKKERRKLNKKQKPALAISKESYLSRANSVFEGEEDMFYDYE